MAMDSIIKINFKVIGFIKEYCFLVNFKVFNQSCSSFNLPQDKGYSFKASNYFIDQHNNYLVLCFVDH